MHKFSITYFDRTPLWVRGLHIAFAGWLAKHYPIKHQIKVYLWPFVSIATFDGGRCWGYFSDEKPLEIGLACRWPACCKCRPKQCTRDRSIKCHELLDCFAHEFVHYERWRDKRPQNHRGLQRRVNALVRRFEDDFHKSNLT